MREISTNKLNEYIKNNKNPFIIDVRDRDEFALGHIKNAINVPLSDIEDYSDNIPEDIPVYFICKVGNRSSNAILLLEDLDIKNCVNVRGGMLSWSGEIVKE